MKYRRIIYLFPALIVIFAMALGACAPNSPNAEEIEVVEQEIEEETESGAVTDLEEGLEGFPVTVENCGRQISVEAPPERAVTMNQSATEVMLALGLEDRMVGTAYIDDAILPEFEEAYNSVPVLSETYPSPEILFGTDPDFIYGGFSSAFNDDNAGPQAELAERGIASYVSPSYCVDKTFNPEQATIETTYKEIRDIAALFGVSDRAEALIAEMQAKLDEVDVAIADLEETPTVFWYDSGDPPFVGACCGGPGMILDLVGAENIFEDAEGSFATVSWEEVLDRDPDAIVIIEADWSTSAEKIELLKSNPAYADLQAVQQENFIIIPFSYTILGVRNADAVEIIAQGLYPAAFGESEADSSVEAEAVYPRTIVDTEGNEVTVTEPVSRIVVSYYGGAEVLRTLDAQDLIVGVGSTITSRPDFFPALSALPGTGKTSVDEVELVLDLEPDMVIIGTGSSNAEVKAKLLEVDPELTVVQMAFYKEEFHIEEIEKLAYLLDKEEEAEAYFDYYDEVLGAIAEQVGGLAEDERPDVYLESTQELKTGAVGSSWHQKILTAGGFNVYGKEPVSLPEVTAESVVEKNPDFIFKVSGWNSITFGGYSVVSYDEMQAAYDAITSRPAWDTIKAVENGQVYIMWNDILGGPRYFIGVSYLAKYLHPDLFQEFDPQAVHQTYVTTFQGLDIDLSEIGVFVYAPE